MSEYEHKSTLWHVHIGSPRIELMKGNSSENAVKQGWTDATTTITISVSASNVASHSSQEGRNRQVASRLWLQKRMRLCCHDFQFALFAFVRELEVFSRIESALLTFALLPNNPLSSSRWRSALVSVYSTLPSGGQSFSRTRVGICSRRVGLVKLRLAGRLRKL